MQGKDGLGEGGDPVSGALEFAQESPVLESGHSLFDEGADLGMGSVHSFLTWGKG
jgi:hypothetical protein